MERTTATTYMMRINSKITLYKDTLQTLAGDEIKSLATDEQIDSKRLFIESIKVIQAYYALLRDNVEMDPTLE